MSRLVSRQGLLNPWGFLDGFERNFDFFSEKGGFTPPVDYWEDDRYLYLSADIPGIKKEDVALEIKDDTLTLSGERRSEKNENGFSEKSYGGFKRVFTLPKTVDGEKVVAKFEHGVLNIKIEKKEEVQSKKIEVL